MAIKKIKKILTEKELVKYLNNFGIARHLKFFAGTLIEDPVRKKGLSFKFNLGGTSFTDGKDITIGVPSFLISHTKEEILGSLKAMTGHESEHINSTPMDLYKDFILKFAEYFKDKHGIHEAIGQHVGNYLANCVEDGRIERILIKRAPGLLNPLIYFRSLWWKDTATKAYDASKPEPQKELFDTLFIFCTFATMGQYPSNYPNVHTDELCDMMRKLKPDIFDAVNSDDYVESTDCIWRAIYKIEDWLVEEFKKIPDPDKFKDDMDSERGGDFGTLSEGNTTTSRKSRSKGKVSSKPLEPKSEEDEEEKKEEENPIHEAFDDEEEEDEGDKGDNEENPDIDGIGEGTDGGKYDSDEKMRRIVDNAIRNAEEKSYEDMHDAVAQADFDDLAEKKKAKEESAKSSGTNLSEEDTKAVRDLYSSLDRSWDVPLRVHKYKYDTLKAPDKVRLEGKKTSKEFEEIFLNKASMKTKNKKRGTLDTTCLWKIGVNDTDVFQKKGHPNETDYVFYILVDGSGSMCGNKYREALRATSVLEESLSKFAPLKISQFDCDGKHVNHYIIKDFEDNKKEKNYSWTFANHKNADNCNMDGYSIRIAIAELRKRPERKKVLIILSDGLPSGAGYYYGHDAEQDVKNAIREGRKDRLDIFNIMFGEEYERKNMLATFKYMYERCIVNCNPEDISRTLLKIVKKELKK